VAFRGSVNADDAKTDAFLALGRLKDTDRWKRTAEHLRLGGTLAQLAHDELANGSERTNSQLVAFNPGATILGAIPGREGRVYSTHGDVVSALAHTTHKDVRVLKPTGGDDLLGAHGVANFTAPA